MEESFVIIDNIEYRKGDWLLDKQLINAPGPTIIVNVFEDLSEVYIIVRSPYLEHALLSVTDFIQQVKLLRYEKIQKPSFQLGQLFRNRFTEKSIEIKDVPHQTNEKEGEYVYYVLEYTSTYGYNFTCLAESTIQQFYVSEGVDEI